MTPKDKLKAMIPYIAAAMGVSVMEQMAIAQVDRMPQQQTDYLFARIKEIADLR